MDDLDIPQHADVRIACDDLYKIEKAAAELGFSSPALTRARDLLNTMSARVSLLENRAPDPAVVALVRAVRLLHDNIVEGAFIKEDNIILVQDALAPFKHIEDERP